LLVGKTHSYHKDQWISAQMMKPENKLRLFIGSWYLNTATPLWQHCQFLFCQDGHGLVHMAKGSLPKESHENQTLVLVLPAAVM